VPRTGQGTGVKTGSRLFKPRLFRIGSPKAINNPIKPIQKQHKTTHTKITMGQGFFLREADDGGSGTPGASAID